VTFAPASFRQKLRTFACAALHGPERVNDFAAVFVMNLLCAGSRSFSG
jgi:hypothetical protein